MRSVASSIAVPLATNFTYVWLLAGVNRPGVAIKIQFASEPFLTFRTRKRPFISVNHHVYTQRLFTTETFFAFGTLERFRVRHNVTPQSIHRVIRFLALITLECWRLLEMVSFDVVHDAAFGPERYDAAAQVTFEGSCVVGFVYQQMHLQLGFE